MKLFKKLLTFIFNTVYTAYYLLLLYVNFLQNLLLYPIFFVFFGTIKWTILIIYNLFRIKYFFYVSLLMLLIFVKIVKTVFDVLFKNNEISYPKLRRLFSKKNNFHLFYNDTKFLPSRKDENALNRSLYLKNNRYLYHFDYLNSLIESEDELESIEIDLNIKPQRFYFVNDFYRDEKIYFKLMANLKNSKHEMDIIKNNLLLKKLLHNIRFQSLTVSPTATYLVPKSKFPTNPSKLFLKYFNLFNGYTLQNLTNFFDFNFNHLNVYIRRRAFFLSQDYLNYDWFSYNTINLKDYLNYTSDEFDINDFVEELYSDEDETHYLDEFEILDMSKQDLIEFDDEATKPNYPLFFNDFIFITLKYKIKKNFNLIFKLKYLIYFYNNYFYYLIKYVKLNFSFLYISIAFLLRFLNKVAYRVLKFFYFKIYKHLFLISNYRISDIPVLIWIKSSTLLEIIKDKVDLYYKITKIVIEYYFEKLILYPLIELNYVYVFIVIKFFSILAYIYLKIKETLIIKINKFKKC